MTLSTIICVIVLDCIIFVSMIHLGKDVYSQSNSLNSSNSSNSSDELFVQGICAETECFIPDFNSSKVFIRWNFFNSSKDYERWSEWRYSEKLSHLLWRFHKIPDYPQKNSSSIREIICAYPKPYPKPTYNQTRKRGERQYLSLENSIYRISIWTTMPIAGCDMGGDKRGYIGGSCYFPKNDTCQLQLGSLNSVLDLESSSFSSSSSSSSSSLFSFVIVIVVFITIFSTILYFSYEIYQFKERKEIYEESGRVKKGV